MTRSITINLTANDAAVLRVLDGATGAFDDVGFMNFGSIARTSGVDRKSIRRVVRRLARAGYAQFSNGLWTEDGRPAGAGYAITKAGRTAVDSLPSSERQP